MVIGIADALDLSLLVTGKTRQTLQELWCTVADTVFANRWDELLKVVGIGGGDDDLYMISMSLSMGFLVRIDRRVKYLVQNLRL